MEARYSKQSRTIKTSLVLPPDINHIGTMFGGKVTSYIDEVAAIAATRHAQRTVVTASMDPVDFLSPIKRGDAVTVEGFVTWTGRSSMEVYVKVISENLYSGEKQLTATSFLTMVALDDNGKPAPVPRVIPETDEEKYLHRTAPERQKRRKERKQSFDTSFSLPINGA
jgi:acyl-CoA hydrolase